MSSDNGISSGRRHSRVALAHDYLLVSRGAERTFAAMAECWPEAPIYTLLYDEAGTEGRFASHPVHPSFLQALRVRQSWFRYLLPFYPEAVRTLGTTNHELVVSSSSAFANGVRVAPGAVHVCYCHSPFRYAWHERAQAIAEVPRALRRTMAALLASIRERDREAARGIDRILANSETTRRRIQDFWDRDATVVHPPVDVDRFDIGEPEDYFLVVGEVVRHKRVEVALEAARRARVPLKVVGSGPELTRLQHEYEGSAQFLGRVEDRELADVYAHARALIVPTMEEFGIAGVEAQAAGRPVVAARGGGQLETVKDGESGVFVPFEDPDALAETLRYTNFEAFSPQRIKANARRFSVARFQQEIRREVDEAVSAGATHDALRPRRFARRFAPAAR
jgi:glycosyltransferase involved in cell wall biosynthesis